MTIKVSDEGGGIPRSGLASIWTYLYSTAKSRVQVEKLQVGGGSRVLMELTRPGFFRV